MILFFNLWKNCEMGMFCYWRVLLKHSWCELITRMIFTEWNENKNQVSFSVLMFISCTLFEKWLSLRHNEGYFWGEITKHLLEYKQLYKNTVQENCGVQEYQVIECSDNLYFVVLDVRREWILVETKWLKSARLSLSLNKNRCLIMCWIKVNTNEVIE